MDMSIKLEYNSTNKAYDIYIMFGSTDRKKILERHTFYNSGIIDDGYEKIKFDEKSNSYLITIWNDTSNYGARIGVIIYKNRWWNLFILPFDKFDITDTNNDGIMEIKHNDNIYSFNNGILVPQQNNTCTSHDR